VASLLKSDRLINYRIDLADTEQIQKILVERDIEYVFHLAAQSHVDNSFNNSLQFSKDNVYATHSLLEACKNYGKIKRFIHVSTDEIYGETLQTKPFCESELPNPTNPYAATKVGAEYIAKSYYHCFELPVIIVRGNNVYGPRQYPEKMIPRFIALLLKDQPCTIAGNGMMKRNFVHVTDVCAGLCSVLLKGKVDEIYNIGDDDERSVLDVAELLVFLIKNEMDHPELYYRYVKDRYYNDFRYSIDTTKIRTLGWRPKIDFASGLQDTIRYYQDKSTREIFDNL
jgi:dTDP-glucose 4,6-dehydratase